MDLEKEEIHLEIERARNSTHPIDESIPIKGENLTSELLRVFWYFFVILHFWSPPFPLGSDHRRGLIYNREKFNWRKRSGFHLLSIDETVRIIVDDKSRKQRDSIYRERSQFQSLSIEETVQTIVDDWSKRRRDWFGESKRRRFHSLLIEKRLQIIVEHRAMKRNKFISRKRNELHSLSMEKTVRIIVDDWS